MYRGPALLIVAGAGSGKTSVLTRRIASLLRNREAWPSQILAITFTNRAFLVVLRCLVTLVALSPSGPGDCWYGFWADRVGRTIKRLA